MNPTKEKSQRTQNDACHEPARVFGDSELKSPVLLEESCSIKVITGLPHSTMATIKHLKRLLSEINYPSLASQKTSTQLAVTDVGQESWKNSLKKEDPKTRNVRWVFLGCPGVGKGTYASRLSRLLGVPHIATGDLIREELTQSGPSACKLANIVRRGKLVPDDIIVNLLSRHLAKSALKGETGFILDGFPRTLNQAEILEHVTDIDLVINLRLREEALLQKCLGRRICSQCGGNFNVASVDIEEQGGEPAIHMAPLLPPLGCESKLITREDDTEEVVKERLRVYQNKSQPVEDFYRSRGKLLEFDLPGGIPESWPKLLTALNIEENEDKNRLVALNSLPSSAMDK